MQAPDFLGLKVFADGLPLSEQLRDIHNQISVLVEVGTTDGEYLRVCMIAFELAMCARVTQAVWQEERLAYLEAQRHEARPHLLPAWMRSKYRSGV